MVKNTDVVVIGGGYAGVTAANRLAGQDDVTVTPINPRPDFVERIRLHQLVGGSHDAVVDYGGCQPPPRLVTARRGPYRRDRGSGRGIPNGAHPNRLERRDLA